MKKIIIAMAAIAAAFTMASCNKEPLVEQGENTALGNCTITASTENNLTKTSLEGDDENGYEVVWSEGDTFNLAGNTFTLIEGAGTTRGTFQGNVPGTNGIKTAFYPASYDGSNWPTKQTYTEGNITGSPMKADVYCFKGEIDGGKVEFKNAGGILRLTLKGTAKVGSIKVSATGLDEITLDCGSGVTLDNTNGTVFHIAMPEGEYSGVSIAVWTTDYDDCTKKLKEGTQLKIERSKITTAAFTASFPSLTSTDPLPGAFSIADGKQVCFSRGNLRYTIGYDSGEWSFYDKQYKCGPLHAVDSKEISLFTWGYNATQSINPIGSASNNVSITSGNLSPAQDWGSVFGNNSPWRTLTSAEWTYLFEGRTDASQKYGYATVGGQKGLIILPDEFTDPMKNGGSGAFKPQSSTGSRWTDNYYTLAGNWEAMEAAGAVFLPAAGRRGGNSIATGSNEQGHYWSSSAADSDKAYFVYFNDNSFDPAYSWRRDNGCSVRLVMDVYTVTFDMNGKEGTAPESLTKIKHGSTITKPSDPTAEGYAFAGWYKDETCTKAWDFDSDVVTANISLYAKWVEGALPGKFSVSASKEVYFSLGNLWYGKTNKEAESATFNFEANQYDFNSGDYDTEHISHFMWSKDAEVACALQYDGQSASNNDVFFTNADETTPNPNFTANGQKGMWRTLSTDEWKYLIEHNENIWTNMHGIKGLIVFCDGYSGNKTGLTEIPKGCLFLPAAGYRSGDNGSTLVDYVGLYGFYWSASSSGNNYAFDLLFNSGDVDPFRNDFRNQAFSVRLVTDVE